MKKLIFIDNDNETKAAEDVDNVKNALEYGAKLPLDYVDSVEIVPNFFHLSKEEKAKILFSPENCICSYSMYTANHFSSLFQMMEFLAMAGRNEIKDIIYLDISGNLPGAFKREIRDIKKDLYAMLNAIETNYIMIFSMEGGEFKFQRLRIDLKGVYEDPFRFEDVDLKKLLGVKIKNGRRSR